RPARDWHWNRRYDPRGVHNEVLSPAGRHVMEVHRPGTSPPALGQAFAARPCLRNPEQPDGTHMGKVIRCEECGRIYRTLEDIEDLRDNDGICMSCNAVIEVSDWDRILASYEEEEDDLDDVDDDDLDDEDEEDEDDDWDSDDADEPDFDDDEEGDDE